MKKAKGVKRRKKVNKPCKYCATFLKSEVKRVETDRGSTAMGRICNVTGQEIQADTEACENFILGRSFWCNKEDNWIYIVACIHRRKREYPGCLRCKQGSAINKLYEEANAT